VGGAQVSSGGVTRQTNGAGQVTFDRITPGAPLSINAGGNFLLRQSRFSVTAPSFSLWPVGPGMDSVFVKELVYSLVAGVLVRPTGPVYLVLSAEMRNDAAVRDFQVFSASLVTRANGNGIPFVVSDNPPAGAVVFNVLINPNLGAGTAALTRYNTERSRMTGGAIEFKSRSTALDAAVAPHEYGHAYGLGHPTQLGMMHATTYDYSDFTAEESLEMRLMLQRAPGNGFPDNDDNPGALASLRNLEIVCPDPRPGRR
jgi:hypothetical protein